MPDRYLVKIGDLVVGSWFNTAVLIGGFVEDDGHGELGITRSDFPNSWFGLDYAFEVYLAKTKEQLDLMKTQEKQRAKVNVIW